MPLTQRYAATLDEIRAAGLFKSERIITGPQSAEIELADGRTVTVSDQTHPDLMWALRGAGTNFGVAT